MPFFDHLSRRNSRNSRNLQEGLFQIASQTCNLLVQVNNTNNISFGNNSTNVTYNTGPNFGAGPSRNTKVTSDDEQFMILLPPNGKAAYKPILSKSKSRLSTVLENISFNNDDNASDITQNFSYRDDHVNIKWRKTPICKPSCIPISLLLVLIFLVVFLPIMDHAMDAKAQKLFSNKSLQCDENFKFFLVESIPEGLEYPENSPKFEATYEIWSNLIKNSEKSIDIASFYWSLRCNEPFLPENLPGCEKGQEIFHNLLKVGSDKKVKIRIAQNYPTQSNPNLDTEIFVKKGAAEVRSLNFQKLLGAGVLHTKFWIFDKKHLYIGSANMDWRSLTQVKEMGIVIMDCPCLAEDLRKIFEVYWSLGVPDAKIPSKWPQELETQINMEHPLTINIANSTYKTYISSSPLPFNPLGRTNDIDALLNVIQKAEKYIYISVMDYFPLMIYSPKIKFWPVIDDALRTAAIEHKVTVRLLISYWKHSRGNEDNFLRSLQDLNKSYPGVNIEIKRFVVPSTEEQEKIPFARVNHNKYMVTDNMAFIGTSNWSGDYFTDTAGISLIFEDFSENDSKNDNQTVIRDHLKSVFDRDWNSNYSFPLKN